jgi:hypothetical protein
MLVEIPHHVVAELLGIEPTIAEDGLGQSQAVVIRIMRRITVLVDDLAELVTRPLSASVRDYNISADR